MNRALKHLFFCASFLAWLAAGPVALARGPRDAPSNQPSAAPPSPGADDKLIAALASDDVRKVDNALEDVENKTHPGTNLLGAVKKLLPDPRPSIRQKAARVLGTLHAEVDQNDLKAICFMLKSHDQREASNALKSLRGLGATNEVPEILPLLKNPHPLVIREACRTLAVLGNKDVISAIEPLLDNPDSGVKAEAKAAIAALRAKL